MEIFFIPLLYTLHKLIILLINYILLKLITIIIIISAILNSLLP